MAHSRLSGARATRGLSQGEIPLQDYVLANTTMAALDTPSTGTTCLAGKAIPFSVLLMPVAAMPSARNSGPRHRRRQ